MQHSRSALVVGCFDGHYGHRASEWAASRLAKDILEAADVVGEGCSTERIERMLITSYARVDKSWLEHASHKEMRDGSTAVVCLVHGGMLHIANAGDSRAVACYAGEAYVLSRDHTGKLDSERQRIEALGGEVSVTGRVRGKLMVTRAIGDRPYKLGLCELTAEPEVRSLTLSPALEFVVLASDGLWDVISSSECVELVRSWTADLSQPPQKTARDLTELALNRGSQDNVSVALLMLQHDNGSSGGSDGGTNEPLRLLLSPFRSMKQVRAAR